MNPILIHNGPLHDVNNGVWCAISATRVTQPISFPTSSIDTRYVKQILTPFWADGIWHKMGCW